MDLSPIPGIPNSPLPTYSVFGDNALDLISNGANAQSGATIVVNSIDDAVNSSPSVTTLRDAINKANGDSQKDLIVFDRSLFSTAQTITLTGGELDITHDVGIVAPRDTLTGGDLVKVSGSGASRVFEIESGAKVSFNGLIVADGSVTNDNGGGIKNSGSLSLDSSIVRGNSAQFGGGGINNSGTVTVNNSTISGNSAGDGGGGIYNTGSTVTVNNSTISGNSADFGGGGGIDSLTTGTLTVSKCTISANSAFFDYGGGINSEDGGTVTVENSTISSNSADFGGGIRSNGGTLTVENSTISGNSTQAGGGGIYADSTLTVKNSTISGNSVAARFFEGGGIYGGGGGGTVTVENSTISGNSAGDGGGIYGGGTLTVKNSTISGNSASDEGGGIYNDRATATVVNSTINGNSALPSSSDSGISGNGGGIRSSFGTLTVSKCTISGNSADFGGGIYNDGYSPVTVNNSTISSNSATQNGGGIYNNYIGTLTLLFSTITQNIAANGGGVYKNDVPEFSTGVRGSNSVRNTIIAANLNSAGGVNPDVEGTFTSLGYNLIGNSTGSTGFGATGDIVGTSASPINPRLDLLKSNGGPTQTIVLLKGSPAINAGDPTVLPTDPKTDQRGRPRVQLGRADIGAFESNLKA